MADQRPPAAALSERSWTITGANAETRELVREAAAKDGLTIRAWVDKTLNAAAREVLEEGGNAGTRRPVKKTGDDLDAAAIADLSAKIDLVLSRLDVDPNNAAASLQTPLAAVYERFLTRTAAVFDELGETSRRLAEAAADAENEAAQVAAAAGAASPRSTPVTAKAKPKPKPKPAAKKAKPKVAQRAKSPRKARGKPKKRTG